MAHFTICTTDAYIFDLVTAYSQSSVAQTGLDNVSERTAVTEDPLPFNNSDIDTLAGNPPADNVKRKRGRPKGSKNKPKQLPTFDTTNIHSTATLSSSSPQAQVTNSRAHAVLSSDSSETVVVADGSSRKNTETAARRGPGRPRKPNPLGNVQVIEVSVSHDHYMASKLY